VGQVMKTHEKSRKV